MNLLDSNGIRIEPLKCLRGEYYHNECSKCIDVCPTDAITLVSKRISIDSVKCTNCNACIGICPTSTLVNSGFDTSAYIIKNGFDKDLNLTCDNNRNCISIFKSEELISLALRAKSVICDMSKCDECKLNIDNKVSSAIEKNIEEANRFLKDINKSPISINTKKIEISRREAFISFVKDVSSIDAQDDSADMLFDPKETLPKSRIIFQNSLKAAIENLPTQTINDKFSFFTHKKIDFKSCDNCGDCVQFCPTNALSFADNKTKIIFMQLRCIACGICDDICKQRSIESDDSFDLVTLAFNRAEVLIENHFEVCSECKVSFPQKENEKICKRCIDFANAHSSLFALARDVK
ncbi:MAG: 4Fe-4S binding protein [Epsilonproteobacteria bacterium]|nr:4Fe-4S binding protein [Campylobacterota bacterium]